MGMLETTGVNVVPMPGLVWRHLPPEAEEANYSTVRLKKQQPANISQTVRSLVKRRCG